MPILKIVLLVFVILSLNTVLNGFRWIATRRYHVRFQKGERGLLRRYAAIKRLFGKAGMNEIIAGHIDDSAYRSKVEQCFDMAESVYSFRIKHPISYILQFPIRIMNKIGIPKSTITKKIIGAVFWPILLLAEYTIGIFLDLELRETLEQFIRSIMKFL